MLRVAIIEQTAESRRKLILKLEGFLKDELTTKLILPRISLLPVSPQELKFSSTPDICIIGPELLNNSPNFLCKTKSKFSLIPLIACVDENLADLENIERLTSNGADDILPSTADAEYFFKRLLIIGKKVLPKKSGKLILVDGGKGGVGITTLAASLAEIAALNSNSIIIDCDYETQDCLRFLQSPPFLNETLRMLLNEEFAITEETVQQSIHQVWHHSSSFYCLPPPIEHDSLYVASTRLAKLFLSVLEILDTKFDNIIIDIGCARGALQKMLYRIADKLVFVVNDDPATFYASLDRLTKARSKLSPSAEFFVVENCTPTAEINCKLLRQEFSKIARISSEAWSPSPIPFCKIGRRWPGSGGTFYSQAKLSAVKPIEELAVALGILHSDLSSNSLTKFIEQIRIKYFAKRDMKLKSEQEVIDCLDKAKNQEIKLITAFKKPDLPFAQSESVDAYKNELFGS